MSSYADNGHYRPVQSRGYRMITLLMMTILVSEACPRAPDHYMTQDTWSPESHVTPHQSLLSCWHLLAEVGPRDYCAVTQEPLTGRCWANWCNLLTTKNFLMKILLDDVYLTTFKINESGWMGESWHKTRKKDSFIFSWILFSCLGLLCKIATDGKIQSKWASRHHL